MNREALERNQIPLYFIAVLAAAFIGLLAPGAPQILDALITPSIAVLMYAMFLQIPFLELRNGLSNRRFICALLLANFLVIPILVWCLTRGLTEHPALLAGALLVLLTPCIDYVVVFTHLGKGDAKLTLAATPLLLLLQFLLLPVYLPFMLGNSTQILISVGPFVEAFAVLILLPMALAVATLTGAKKSRFAQTWCNAWAWMPVPAMAGVLIAVIGSQIAFVMQGFDRLLPVIPIYLGFILLAPLAGAFVAKLCGLEEAPARSVVFSSTTRNSLVVLPLALALPEDIRTLAAAAVITQTLVELLAELLYIRAIPALVGFKR